MGAESTSLPSFLRIFAAERARARKRERERERARPKEKEGIRVCVCVCGCGLLIVEGLGFRIEEIGFSGFSL